MHLPPASCSIYPILSNAPPKGLAKPLPNHPNKKSMDCKKSVLAREEYVLQSLTMQPSAFDNPPLPCKLSPPVHHGTAGELVSNRIWGRPQVVRKCLNGTAANNADFRITAEDICGNEHMTGSVDHNVTPMCT